MGITKVDWSINPNGVTTWTYGNYGGKGWSAGEFTPPGTEPAWEVRPLDELDSIFQIHDLAYAAAEKAFDASEKTTADQFRYAKDILMADATMVLSIEAFFNPIIPKTEDALEAADQARTAFLFKLLYEVANVVLSIPVPGIYLDPFTGLPWSVAINPTVNTNFLSARNFVIQSDPLVLDLDGDGLELTGASGAILFDHNADNIKTGSGWAARDDGFLVRDLNGNGTIDTGRELFGVDTIKSNNTLATQGFDALRDLDSNADGQITSADAAYGQLKVWQDANQDGISQSTELKTLAQQGITRIGLNGTSTGPQAGQTINNNQVALSTTFTRNGQTRTVGAIDLEANNFFTEFPPQVVDETGNLVAITAQAQSLPQMNGAGMVRNMRAAA